MLAWLNKRAGRSWAKDDLAGELEELQQAEAETPDDLNVIPALYGNGKRYDGYVEGLVGD